MTDEIIIDIKSTSFPSQLAPDSVKESKEFGLQVGQAIQYEWFRKDSATACRFYGQWKEYHLRRLYARAEQPIAKYKNQLAIDGDLSYLNLDWTPIPILPKFVDIVVNGMSERLFNVKAYAQDAMSQDYRNQYQQQVQGQVAAKDILSIIQDSTGANPFMMNPDDLPSNDEEMQLHMQLYFKPAIEIAEEESINTVFDLNHYSDIRKSIEYDAVTLGICVGKHEFYPGSGIKISYVDPANVVYSYTEDPYFRDCFYWGEVKTVPITELVKIKPDIDKETLEKASQYASSWYNYYDVAQFYQNDMFFKDTCTLLFFNYKTTKKFVYKKKYLDNGSSRIIEKDENFNPPQDMMDEGNFERIEKIIDVWYEGVLVMGSNILLKWDLCENMVRPKSATQHAMPNYVACAPRMYKGNIESLVKRMIPFADLIQMTHLKLQQVVNRVTPDGVFLDADGLNEVDLGTGAAYTPEDALRLYFQTGSVIGRSFTQDGEFNHGKVPIKEIVTNSGASKVQMLIANYNHYLDMIRAVTGLNEARDGSMPDPHSLVGLQKLAALNSNTATRHVLDSSLFIYRSLAEAITYRISDILEYSDFRDEFINQIGKYNVGLLDEVKDLYIYDFGIFIELAPDEEQRAKLEENIQVALSKGDINLEDAIDIRGIKNLKLANQLLKIKRIKKQEREEKMAMQSQAITAQQQMQSQQLAAQTAIQKIQAEGQMKIQVKQSETEFEMSKLQREAELKMVLMQREFQYNIELAKAQGGALSEREQAKEDAKAKRISQQNSEQSKLINQRKNNLPPINFESNEDSLDGFDMGEFEPR
mgnify:CR=1 FL=1